MLKEISEVEISGILPGTVFGSGVFLYQCPISPQLHSEQQTSFICIIISFAVSFIKNNEPLCT